MGASPEELEDRADFTQDYTSRIVNCRTCGLVMRSPHPAAADILESYTTDAYGRERLESLLQTQIPLYRRKAATLARWLPRGAAVVEAGSFVGAFLQAGRDRGWRMLGIDPGAEVSRFCIDRDLAVRQSTLPEARLRPGAADCVAIWNTFDQLPDPGPTLAAAREALAPGGLLVLRVPNGAAFATCSAIERHSHPAVAGWIRCAMAWNNLLAFPYLYGYSRGPLALLLGGSGFRLARVQGDVLCRLSDRENKRWAIAEEWATKRLWRVAGSCLSVISPKRSLMPWLDVHATLTS